MKKSFDYKKDEFKKDISPIGTPIRKERGGIKTQSKEKLTPEEVWKNAAMVLGSKKKENILKASEKIKKFDFNDIHHKVSEINKDRIAMLGGDNVIGVKEKFYEIETANSIINIPNFSEVESLYKPRNFTETPDFFPKVPLYIFDCPDTFKKLDADTLFFIFYSQLGTIQQYYAASQLKLYSWRFHTKYFTWFQRLDEPKLITADYERGDFLFFDYDVTWSFMKKSDFTFEYKYLECSEW